STSASRSGPAGPCPSPRGASRSPSRAAPASGSSGRSPRATPSHATAPLLLRRRRPHRDHRHHADELLAGRRRVEVRLDALLVERQDAEAEHLPVGRGDPVLLADDEGEARGHPVARQAADELRPFLAVRLRRRDAELARLAGPHAGEPILERREELPGAVEDGHGPARPGRIDGLAAREPHRVLDRHDDAGCDLHQRPPRSCRTIAPRRSGAPAEPPLVTTGSPAYAPVEMRARTTSGQSRASSVSAGCPRPSSTW